MSARYRIDGTTLAIARTLDSVAWIDSVGVPVWDGPDALSSHLTFTTDNGQRYRLELTELPEQS